VSFFPHPAPRGLVTLHRTLRGSLASVTWPDQGRASRVARVTVVGLRSEDHGAGRTPAV